MARVTDLDISPEVEDLMREGIKTGERHSYNRVDRKAVIWRKRNLKEVELRSQMDEAAVLWNNLSDANKALWSTAGSHCGLTGYRLFLQDTTYRLSHDIAGVATPNNHHQYKVFELVTGDDCPDFYLEQYHYTSNHIRVKVSGDREAYYWTDVSEPMTPPFLFEFDYYSDLELTGGGGEFQAYIRFHGTKGGVDSYDPHYFNLTLQTGWTRFSQNVTPDLDVVEWYDIGVLFYLTKGTFRMDNANSFHNGENFAFNPNCDRMLIRMVEGDDGPDFPWSFNWEAVPDFYGSKYLS